MRVKTDDRRAAILEAAVEVFREVGYERASMAAISARVGGSKATLYGYYKSKEELFAAAMMGVMEEQAAATIALLDPSEPDVGLALCRFGKAVMELLSTPDVVSIIRTAISEGAHSTLGATLFSCGPERGLNAIAAYLAQLQEKGLIRPCDPRVAAVHLKGLLDAGTFEPRLFGAPPCVDPKVAVADAVEVFLRAYGAEPG